jgi:ParB-like chromosome segregation protein Spo0J
MRQAHKLNWADGELRISMTNESEAVNSTSKIVSSQAEDSMLGPACNLPSDWGDDDEGLSRETPTSSSEPAAGANTDLSPNLLNGPHDKDSAIPSEFRLVPLSDIRIPEQRLRGAIEEFIPAMMESVASVGQIIQPPTIRPDELDIASFELVCGRQRIEAARRMGLGSILCRIVQLTDSEAQLWEIDENLIRNGLSPAQEAIYVDRRKELHEREFGKAKARGATAANAAMGRQSNVSAKLADAFTSDTAQKTSKSERTIQRIVQRAAEIGRANLTRLTGTALDRKTELDALARLPPIARETLIERAEAGMEVSAVRERESLAALDPPMASASDNASGPGFAKDADAFAENSVDPIDSEAAELEALKVAWINASDSARAKYLQWLAETQNGSGIMPSTSLG